MENIKTIKQLNSSSNSQPITIKVLVEGSPVEMEIDSGACTSVISEDEYNLKFKLIPIEKMNQTLLAVTGNKINCIGKINVAVCLEEGSEKKQLELIVVKGAIKMKALFGRSWLDAFYPHWRNRFLTNSCINEIKKDLVSGNKNIFEIEKLKNKYPRIFSPLNTTIEHFKANIVLKTDSQPIFHAAYSVPYKLREKVEKELERLCQNEILIPVKYSQWASPIVIVNKPNKGIRICIDCKVTINRCIQTEHYPLPRVDDIFANLANCAFFLV